MQPVYTFIFLARSAIVCEEYHAKALKGPFAMKDDLPTPQANEPEEGVKLDWVKPEITDFEAVTVTRGISYRAGDGISNLS